MNRNALLMLWKLAFRNLLRQRTRTAMTMVAIVVGVAGLIVSGGFVQDIVTQLGEAFIGSQTGHIQIAQASYFESSNRPSDETLLKNVATLKRLASSVPGVEEVMGRVAFSGVINNGKRDFAIVGQGVEPDAESRMGNHLTLLAGQGLNDKDVFRVIVGEGLAHNMGLQPGSQVTLVISTSGGALNTLDLEVSGIFRSFSKDFDARALRISLAAAQSLLATDSVNVLVLRLDKTENTARVASDLRQRLSEQGVEIREWQTLSDFYSKTVELYKRQFGVLQFIVLCMVLLSVTNTINVGTFERISEFGTMRALGTSDAGVMRLIVAECIALGCVGAILGIALGVALGMVISYIGIPMPPPPGSDVSYVAHIRLSPLPILSAGAVGLVSTLAASVIPAIRSCRVPLVDALRRAV